MKRDILTQSAAPDRSRPRNYAHPDHAVHLAILYQGHQAIFPSPDRRHFCFGRDPSGPVLPDRQLLGHTYHSTVGLCGFALVYQSNPW